MGKAENEERGNWAHRIQYMLATFSVAVGLGNVWRFPYKVYESGGASFMIPYLIILALAGLPLFLLETALGQFSSVGPITVWKLAPFFKGIGHTLVFISASISIYYQMLVAYILYYLFASFTSELPWAACKPEWSQFNCRERANSSVFNMTANSCRLMVQQNLTGHSDFIRNCTLRWKTPTEVYWRYIVLNQSEGVTDGTHLIQWPLSLCLLLAWLIQFAAVSRGIKSIGKVVYFTGPFIAILIVILVIRSCLLDGAWRGIEFYVIPKWQKLGEAKVWYNAAVQVFYSLGVSGGTLEMYASYNKFRHNIYRDSLIIVFVDLGISIVTGFAIFPLLGFMAEKTRIPLKDVVDEGPGLVFMVYPEGLATLPVGPLWSILFFLMLTTLGVATMFSITETIVTAIIDEIPTLRRWRLLLVLTVCVSGYLLGLPMCSRAGIYILQILDTYAAGFPMLVAGFLEVCVMSWIYGFRRFSEDVKMMLGFKLNIYWIANWVCLTPCSLMFILVFTFVEYEPVKYEDYVFPSWANDIGWVIVFICLSFIPGMMLYQIWKRYVPAGILPTFKIVLQPTKSWGPALKKHRTGRYSEYQNNN